LKLCTALQTKEQIKQAVKRLSYDPPMGDIKRLQGAKTFRLRVGKYRLIFDIIDNTIVIYDIGLRDKIYKIKK